MSINSFPNGTVDRSIGGSGTRATHGDFIRSYSRSRETPESITTGRSRDTVIVVGNVSADSNRLGLLATRPRLIALYSSANRDCIRLHSHANAPARFPPLDDQSAITRSSAIVMTFNLTRVSHPWRSQRYRGYIPKVTRRMSRYLGKTLCVQI